MLPTTIKLALDSNTWYLLDNSQFIILLKLHYCTGIVDGYWPKNPKLTYNDALFGVELNDLDLVRRGFFKRFSAMLISALLLNESVQNELLVPMLESVIAEPASMKIKDPFKDPIHDDEIEEYPDF